MVFKCKEKLASPTGSIHLFMRSFVAHIFHEDEAMPQGTKKYLRNTYLCNSDTVADGQ